MSAAGSVDDYLDQFSGELRARIDTVRALVRDAAPEAVESLSYGLVGYKLNGKPLVYVGGFTSHVGFYATPNGHEAFKDDFSPYKQGKGSVQFPHDQPLPVGLIKRVIAYRITQTKGDT